MSRGRITSLNLPAVLFLVQPRIPLAFLATGAHGWLMDNLSTRMPRSFSAELLSSRSAPARSGAWGYSSLGPGAGPCTCVCWISRGSSLPISPACPDPSEWQHSTTLGCQTLLPALYHQQTCWGGSIPSSSRWWVSWTRLDPALTLGGHC